MNDQSHVTINSEPNCDECEDFAEELRDVAFSAKWKKSGHPLSHIDPKGSGGIRILTNGTTPPAAKSFALALTSAGITYHWGEFIPNAAYHRDFPAEQWEDYVVLVSRERRWQN
jgi:hypothetical protein